MLGNSFQRIVYTGDAEWDMQATQKLGWHFIGASLPIIMTCVLMCITGCEKVRDVLTDTEKVKWGYETENGPEVWGQLSPEYALCAEGTHQSPIDIVNPTPAELPALVFNYQPAVLNIHNTGHTIEVAYPSGSWIEVDGTRYQLLQFHFHAPSEHTVGGQPFDMEMHLVHKSEAGTLAVVGVLIESGLDNVGFTSIWHQLPSVPGESQRIEGLIFNAIDLLPGTRNTYRYDGSLTTPPCSEEVKWFVLTTPIEMSEAQISAFKAIIHNNNRPVQPLNGRKLLVDSTGCS